MKLSFCVKAATSLHDSDLATLTDSIEHYVKAGMSAEQAELAAVDDMLASLKAERDETVAALREQHPDLFQSDRQALPTPPKTQRIQPVRGSDALGQISARLGGLSPKLLPDLSQQVKRTSKKGKEFTVWSNPPHTGYGPLFRKGGTADMSEVARVLEEAGYLTPGDHPEQQAEAIVKAELNKGGSTLRVGDAGAIDAEMQRRQEMANEDFEADLPDNLFDHLVEQDLEESGYAAASPEVKALSEQLLASAEAAGIDVEAVRETAARGTEEATEDEYHAKLQALLAESIQRLARSPEGDNAGAAEGSAGGGREVAGGQEQGAGPTAGDAGRAEPAGVDNTGFVVTEQDGKFFLRIGDDRAQHGPFKTREAAEAQGRDLARPLLESQSEADLKAKTEREAKALADERKQQQDLIDKARADALAGDFTLTGSNRPADQNPNQGTMFSLQEGDLQTDTPGFKHWSNNAPLISSKAAETHEFKTGERVVVEAYHGTKRPDRVGNRFKASRATSGPMAYHTSSPELASGYAQGKSDTSLANEDNDYPQWFKYKPQGARSTVGIDRAWHFITPEQRAKIAELAPRVTYSEEQEEDGGNKIVLAPEGHNHGTGGYDQHIKEAKGNHLKALVEEWLNSGNLFDDEERFMQVLKLAGFPTKEVTFDSPNAEYPFVYKNYIAMQKPLVTSDIPQEVRDALDTAAKYDRTRAAQGAYGWDKNATTTRDWVKMFNENSTYAWTSIPDKVAKVLRGLGYDGIIDWSGKGGGQHHVPVYIPFEASQIKSAIGNKGKFDPLKGDIRLSQQDFQDTEQLARPDVIEGDASPQDVSAIAKIQSEMRKRSPAFQSLQLTALPRMLKPGPDASEAAQQRYAAVDMAEKLFGKRVVFFTSNIAFANGLQADYLPGMIFVNEATTRPIQAVLGHELTHAMRQDQPALYNRLGDRVRTLLEEPGRYHEQLAARRAARGLPELSFDKLREELIADIVGDNFTDPKFWRDMTQGQPTLFARVLRVVKDFFDSLLAKLKNERPYGTDKYLNDVQAARDAVVEAMSQFAESPKTAAAAAVTEAERAVNASENNDPFYSELSRQVETAKMASAPAQGWKDWLKGLTNKGTVKADEVAWTGLDDFLDMQQGKVSREQVLEFLNGNGVKVTETTLGAAGDEAARKVAADDMIETMKTGGSFDDDAENAIGDWLRSAPGTQRRSQSEALLKEKLIEAGDRREVDEYVDAAGEQTDSTRYSTYQLPGGSNYREVLLTLPTKSALTPTEQARYEQLKDAGSFSPEELNEFRDLRDKSKAGRDGAYKSGHWDQPNVLAHIRLNDRTDADGKRVLFVEEIQSDWAQQGKKRGFRQPGERDLRGEYRAALADARDALSRNDNLGFDSSAQALSAITNDLNWRDHYDLHDDPAAVAAIERYLASRAEQPAPAGWANVGGNPHDTGEKLPAAPFVGKTDAWVALSIKRVIKMAVDEGYDRVAFVNGTQSAERYDLSKQVEAVRAIHLPDGTFDIRIKPNGQDYRPLGKFSAEKLPDAVGKELAEKIVADAPSSTTSLQGAIEAYKRIYPATRASDADIAESEWVAKHITGNKENIYSGLDLKVGGEGMKAFYDQIVPKVAKDVLKKLGGQMTAMNLGQVEDRKPAYQIEQDSQGKWVAYNPRDQYDFKEFDTEAEAKEFASPKASMPAQPGFDITDSMREKAAGGLPMFSLQFTPEEEAALIKAGINTRTRLQRAGDRIRLYYANATRAWTGNWARQFQQGALDQFTGINLAVRREIGALPTDQDPYVAARLANGGTSSVMRGLMLHGQARWAANGQHLEKIPGTEGLLDILKPLGQNLNQFFGWMIGQRAARLMREGRENNFTATDIAALQGLNKGHEAEFRTAALAYAAFKRSVLDVGEKAGLIDAEARKVWDNADYIPFYREIDDKAVFGATGKKGLAGQSSGIRTLKGGEAGLNDPMENILMNFSRLIDASLKNNALRATVDVLVAAQSDIVHKVGYDMNRQIVPASEVKAQLKQAGTPDQIIDIIPAEAFEGMAKMWAIQAPTDPDVVRVMRNGKPEFYRVNDPLLLKALTSFIPFDFPGLGVARAFKRVLTTLVTKTPDFMARNWIRDTVATAIITRDGFNPIKSLTGVVKAYREAGAFEDLLFAGASFQTGDHNAGDPTATGKAMRRALRDKGFDASSASAFMSSIVDTPVKFWEHYLHLGEAIENGNREAVYEAAMNAGRGATAAAFESKDLMDFTLRGSSPMYQLLADVLPFFNARVQGLYRLGRADPKRVALYGTLMMVASLALALANGGNDDYDKLPDWDKETYWHFWIKGVHLRLPKAFELGAVFASIPERIMRYAMGQDTGKKTLGRIWAIARDQLAFDPVPQFIRPAVNAWANKDTFRDRPIENQGDEGKLPSQRYSKITSPTAVATTKAIAPLADEIGLSPKKLEYLVGGYLGIAGLYALGLSDMAIDAISNAPVKPTRRLDQIPLLGTFYREEPALTTVYETDLYKMRTEVDQIYKSIRALKKDDKDDESDALAAKNEKELDARKTLERGAKHLAKLNKERDAIYADREMTKDQKRKAIDELLRERAEVSKETMKSEEVVNAR